MTSNDANRASKEMAKIRKKLQGEYGGLNLSVQAQVEDLIQQATKVDNLCQMYVGWLPCI